MQQGLTLSGRYRLDALIGRGGMGEVWRAADLRLNRPVAVKLLSASHALDSKSVRRFEREALVSAGLQHRGITVVHDAGADEQRRLLFIVMELLDGQDLHQLLAEAPRGLDPDQVRDFGIQIATALAAAHDRGVIHRDIKPANVIRMRDGSLKLCDFGIARLVVGNSVTTRGLIGTPLYMAPEQFGGGAIGPHTDIYSLGCLLYALACGSPPFDGDNVPALMYQHLNATPRSLRDVRPDIPADIEQAVLACLAKSPDHRPPSASALAEALRRPAADAAPLPARRFPPPVTISPPVPRAAVQPRSRTPGRPRTALILGLTATVLAATAGIGAAVYQGVLQGDGSAAEQKSPTATPTTPAAARPAYIPRDWVKEDPAKYVVENDVECGRTSAGFTLRTADDQIVTCNITTRHWSSMVVEATMTFTGKECGSILARRSGSPTYGFTTCGDGHSNIVRWGHESTNQELTGRQRAVGDPTVRLTAKLVGNTLEMLIDGVRHLVTDDSELKSGGVGLGVNHRAGEGSVAVMFKDVSIWHPPEKHQP